MKTISIRRSQLDKVYLAICSQQELLAGESELDGDKLNDLRSWFQEMAKGVDELLGADLEEVEAIGVGTALLKLVVTTEGEWSGEKFEQAEKELRERGLRAWSSDVIQHLVAKRPVASKQ